MWANFSLTVFLPRFLFVRREDKAHKLMYSDQPAIQRDGSSKSRAQFHLVWACAPALGVRIVGLETYGLN